MLVVRGEHPVEQAVQVDSGWWDIRKSAAYVGVSIGFLRKAVRLKKVPFARAGKKALRFRRSDLDRWLEANGSAGEVAQAKNNGR
jgi:excisionase family DNA binding protein